MGEITRVIEWNVSGWMLRMFYVGAFAAIAFSAWRLIRHVRVWRSGRPIANQPTLRGALQNLVAWAFRGQKMSRDPYAAWMHHLTLWGFFILFVGTTLVFLEEQTPLHFFYGTFYVVASSIIDLGGLAFLAGISMAIVRRYALRTPPQVGARLLPSNIISLMLFLLLTIGVSGFLLEGARIGVDLPPFESASLVGYPIALALRAGGATPESLVEVHRWLWGGHAVLCIAFFALGSAHFFKHVVVSALAVALSAPRRGGALRPYPLAGSEPSGRASVADLYAKDLIDADACTSCGRCTSVCPATAAAKALDPRAIMLKIAGLVETAASSSPSLPPSAWDTIRHAEIWDCTTCGACNFECPIHLQVFDKIIDLRRQLVDLGGLAPTAQAALEGTANRQNPWNYPPAQRALWRESLGIPVVDAGKPPEWIYWIGCAGAFEPSAQAISKSTAAILKKAGVDFAVLGNEGCTGDPARRLGEEGLFRRARNENLERLRATGARKIVTHCPHCLNSLRNEYSDDSDPTNHRNREFEVIHHSQLIAQLIAEKKISLVDRGTAETVTFHDPCYLGRHNGEYDAPRTMVAAVPGLELVEMPRSREKSFCCGGGGGQMWLDSPGKERVEGLRLAEAEGTRSSLVATGCPFCKVMLESAAVTKGKDKDLRVRDVAEIVFEAMEP